MDDTIDRQAAIDEISRWIGYIDEDMILRIQTGLKKLPSAQPEIVRCGECKHHDGVRCFRWNSTIITGVYDFCSNGERRDEDERSD